VSDTLRKRLTAAVDRFERNLAYTPPEAWHERAGQLRQELADIAAGFTETTHWAVAYGGTDPNDVAGYLQYDDEAEAREHLQWMAGDAMVAQRPVLCGRWERAGADVR
jgi:hypothetical protein